MLPARGTVNPRCPRSTVSSRWATLERVRVGTVSPGREQHGASSQLQSSGETRDPPHDELSLSAQGHSGSRTSWTRIVWVLSACARWHFLLFATLAMLWESDLSGLCPWVPPSPTSGSVMGSPGTADGEGSRDFPVAIEPWRGTRTTGEDLRSSPHLQSGPDAPAFCALWVAAARPTWAQAKIVTIGISPQFLHRGSPRVSTEQTSVPWQSTALSWQVVGGLLPFRVVVFFFFLFFSFLLWASLMAQWWRSHLPVQEPRLHSWVGKMPWRSKSTILAWSIPWTEEPGGRQSRRSQRVRHDRDDWAHTRTWTSFHLRLPHNIQWEGT